MSGTTLAVRGNFLDIQGENKTLRHQPDSLMLVEDGCIQWIGSWKEGRNRIPASCTLHDHRDKLVVPGFVDCHIHFPQTGIIGSYGAKLLDWLNTYAFPAEEQYSNRAHGQQMAEFFIDELLKNGTTTAMVFCTVHKQSVEAVFEAATSYNMRLIAGKVLMDRNAPAALCDTPETGYAQSRELIEQYHKQGRLLYAVTPRFAPTSTGEQLRLAGALKQEFPDVYVQTHLSENRDEIQWVAELFPERKNYLDVYNQYGLTGNRCMFAHAIHLEDGEWQCLAATNSSIAFCPTSNLFLGSGLFDLRRAEDKNIRVGMATDVGGGTSFNMLQTLAEAYKIGQLRGNTTSPAEALYLATLGGAKALDLDHLLGNFTVGKEADFIILDPQATSLLAMRTEKTRHIEELLFALITLGDDRTISHTYVSGRLVHERKNVEFVRAL
jgi:guanine deaminase